MSTADHPVPERRQALVHAARRVIAEDGLEAAVVLHPTLVQTLATAFAEDMGATVRARTDGAASVDAVVDGLLDGVVEGARAWRDALPLANLGLERMLLFEDHAAVVEPWTEALRTAIETAQGSGVVRADVDAEPIAFLLRDVLDRTAKACVLFDRPEYRDTAATMVRSALRA